MTKNKNTKKIKYKSLPIAIILVLLVFFFAYIILYTDYLQPAVDELTASYISFNNAKSTDELKFTNIKKMKDEKGKSALNSNLTFEVEGEDNQEFEIVLYSVGNNIDESNIKFYLETPDKSIKSVLSETQTAVDNGKIIYKGKIKDNNKYKLYVWIDNSYKGKTKNISYEVKIKSK